MPSYLGSSFAFIGVVIAATGYAGSGAEREPARRAGRHHRLRARLHAVIGLVVMAAGTAWIERLMPPVVTGAVVAVIGLNLAPIAVKGASSTPFDAWMAVIDHRRVGGVAVFTRGIVHRLLILVGLAIAYVIYGSSRTAWAWASRSTRGHRRGAAGSALRASPRRCSTATRLR